jgi:acetyl esterase/lipase
MSRSSATSAEKMYIRDAAAAANPYASPILAQSHSGLPRTFVAAGEFDGLRLESELYGVKLRRAGVETRIIRYLGVGHAFMDQLGYIPQAEDLILEIAADLRLI